MEPHLLINTKEAVRLTCFIISKLDWASHQPLTNTPSSVDRLLLTNSKEAFGLTSLLLISKLDWASHQSLTTTTSSVEPHLFTNSKEAISLTSLKEAFSQLCLLITCTRSKTLFTGIYVWSSLCASAKPC